MKKPDIKAMIDELKPAPLQPVEEDLNNQILSDDPVGRLRQLDWQAQQDEQRMSGG